MNRTKGLGAIQRKLVVVGYVASLLSFAAHRPVEGGVNPNFTIPMHAKPSSFEICDGYLPVDCVAVEPVVNVPQHTLIAVFVFVSNYNGITYLQLGFQWPADWTWVFGLWDCQPGLSKMWPDGLTHIGGSYAFNHCLEGPALTILGRAFIQSGASGCFQGWQPPFYKGFHAGDCSGGTDLIVDSDSPRIGRICIEAGGNSACDSPTPVSGATWGAIKASYR
jgi:hypothetical protein